MSFNPPYSVPKPRRAYTLLGEQNGTMRANGRVGCLVLHGFMGSPVSSRDLATYLAEQGVTVHCPLLPGHGNLPEKIHAYTLDDWLSEADEAYRFLQTKVDHLFVIGHSMGAILAAKIAHEHEQVSGLIMLAPLYDVPDKRIKFVRFLRYFKSWFYPLKKQGIDHAPFLSRVTDYDPTIDLNDPALQEWLITATRISISATWEMVKTTTMGKTLWPRLRVPTIIFQGENDSVASIDYVQKLYELLPGQDKQLKLYPGAGHHLMRPTSPVHQCVWRNIYDFIEVRAQMRQDDYSKTSSMV